VKKHLIIYIGLIKKKMIKEAPKTIKYGRVFRLKMGNEIKKSNLNLNVYKYGIKALESG